MQPRLRELVQTGELRRDLPLGRIPGSLPGGEPGAFALRRS